MLARARDRAGGSGAAREASGDALSSEANVIVHRRALRSLAWAFRASSTARLPTQPRPLSPAHHAPLGGCSRRRQSVAAWRAPSATITVGSGVALVAAARPKDCHRALDEALWGRRWRRSHARVGAAEPARHDDDEAVSLLAAGLAAVTRRAPLDFGGCAVVGEHGQELPRRAGRVSRGAREDQDARPRPATSSRGLVACRQGTQARH